MRAANICMCINNQATLKDLKTNRIEPKLVWECLNNATQLAYDKQGYARLGVGHSYITGNDMTDKLPILTLGVSKA